MAKEKIRKLLRERDVLTGRLNDMTAMLALVAHQKGGEISFTKEEMMTLPEASFAVSKKDGNVSLVLSYLNPPEAPTEQ